MHTITATTKGAMLMTDPAIVLLEATERLGRAAAEVRIAEIRRDSLVPGAPLRYGVEATDRLRRALAEQDAARPPSTPRRTSTAPRRTEPWARPRPISATRWPTSARS